MANLQNQIRRFVPRPFAVLIVLVLCPGCGYPEISPAAYDYATALYSICNRRDESRLDHFTDKLAEATEGGEVSSRESRWLLDIVETARAGNWEEAASSARQMLEDQVEGAP